MRKKQVLEKIEKEIRLCRICRMDSTGLPVPGEGNPNARIVFIGEAPGKTEAVSGRPFVGRSGKFLRTWMQKIGLDDLCDVYITSPVKYLPKKGTPTLRQIEHGRVHLLKQLEIIKPKIIVLMGRVAALGVLGEPISMAAQHGKKLSRDSNTYVFLHHPAAAMRFPKIRKKFVKDFKKLRSLI